MCSPIKFTRPGDRAMVFGFSPSNCVLKALTSVSYLVATEFSLSSYTSDNLDAFGTRACCLLPTAPILFFSFFFFVLERSLSQQRFFFSRVLSHGKELELEQMY
jgi:hypothetical protein